MATTNIGQNDWNEQQLQLALNRVTQERDELRTTNKQLLQQVEKWQLGWPPGHFYSPLPALHEIKARETKIFDQLPRTVPGIDLNEAAQLDYLHRLQTFYPSQPFTAAKQSHLRYFFDNPNYSYGEGIILYCFLNLLRPPRIMEIGSGYSSCVTLDTNEFALQGAMNCTLIEPYPELLLSLLKPDDQKRVQIIPSKIQEVDPTLFTELVSGDILFIDSSHVAKVGSDVNHIFFEILPRLASGVYVHFHDIFYPFEYPKEWIYQGRAWNEDYLIRAFLQYNADFKIIFFNDFLARFYADQWAGLMPLCMRNPGTSLWLQRQ